MHEEIFGTIQEKLGKRRFAVPIVAALLIGALFALAVYPMTQASPKDLPFGIVSLDKGTEFNDEEINIGNTLVGEIMGTNTGDEESFDPSEMAKEGTEKFVEGVGTLQSGLEKLASAATTFSEGTAGVATGANALAQGTAGLVQGSAGVSASATGLVGGIGKAQENVSTLSEIKTNISAAITNAKTAKEALAAIDTTGLSDDAKSDIETQIDKLNTEIQNLEAAATSLDGSISATEADLATLAENAQKVVAGASGLQEAATDLSPLAQGTAMGTNKLAQGSTQLATMLGGVADGTGALKEGAQSLSGMINASLSSDSSSEEEENTLTDAIAWRVYDSQASLEEAVANEELYVAIVVPENFSEALLDSKMGDGDAEPLQIIINEAKSPMITNSIKPVITNLFGTQGVPYEIVSINPIDDSGSMLPYAMMIATMPTFLTAIIATILLYLLTKAPAGVSRKDKIQVAGIRTILITILSGLIGFGLAGLLHLYGIQVPIVELGLFMWIASAALILLFLGLVSLAPPLGVLTILCCFGFGMTLATLPYEMLPAFYQEWVWPWAPQHYISDGVRQILYTGAGFINSSTTILLAMGGVGLACLFLSALLPEIKHEDDHNPLERLKAKKEAKHAE